MRDFIIAENRLSEKERRNLSILDSIRRGGEVSRADISKLTDLNIVTISNYVSNYVKKKLVLETGLDISSGGRRPELLKINPEYGYTIGIDLGSPHLTMNSSVIGVILDATGKVVRKEKIQKEKESFERLTEKVESLTESLIKNSGIAQSNIHGIGVGIWGVMDRYRGMVRYAVEEEEIVAYTTLLDRLEDKFNMPTIIEHDASVAAFGERWSGMGETSAADNLVFLCSDSSCGLIIRGELYRGASKCAGELNLNPPDEGATEKPGECWANYDYSCCLRSKGIDLGVPESLKKVLSENPKAGSIIREISGGDVEKIDFNMVVEAAEKGDDAAKRALEGAGEYLGVKVAFLVNLFNPEIIVIGRGIEKAGDMLLSAVRKSVRKWAYEEAMKVTKILPTSLSEEAVAIGAGALVTQDMFTKI